MSFPINSSCSPTILHLENLTSDLEHLFVSDKPVDSDTECYLSPELLDFVHDLSTEELAELEEFAEPEEYIDWDTPIKGLLTFANDMAKEFPPFDFNMEHDASWAPAGTPQIYNVAPVAMNVTPAAVMHQRRVSMPAPTNYSAVKRTLDTHEQVIRGVGYGLRHVSSKVDNIEGQTHAFKKAAEDDVAVFKEGWRKEMSEFKQEFQELKEEFRQMKQECKEMKQDFQDMRKETLGYRRELKQWMRRRDSLSTRRSPTSSPATMSLEMVSSLDWIVQGTAQ